MTLENIRFSSNTGIGEIEVHSFLPKEADIYMIIVHVWPNILRDITTLPII